MCIINSGYCLEATLECFVAGIVIGDWLYNLPRAPSTTISFNLSQISWGHSRILFLQKGVRFSFVLLLLTFYEAFSVPVKNEKCGEGNKSKFNEQQFE